jgi:hypothetical protein
LTARGLHFTASGRSIFYTEIVMHTHDSFNALLRGELAATETYQQALVRTENVVGRSDSAAKALVGAGGVSPADAESLIAFHLGGKWEYGRRFLLRGADAPCARNGARLCHAPLPAYATRM